MQQLIQLSHASTNICVAEPGVGSSRDTWLILLSKGAQAKVWAQSGELWGTSAPRPEENKQDPGVGAVFQGRSSHWALLARWVEISVLAFILGSLKNIPRAS